MAWREHWRRSKWLDPWVRRWRRWRGRDIRFPVDSYDYQTVEVMRRILKPHSTGLDVGTHRGQLLDAMIEIAPRGRHHAFDFIKLDIEGGEYHALRGAETTLRRCRPVLVFEAGTRSSNQYGVTPEMMHAYLVDQLNYELNLMARWLASQPPLTLAEFVDTWRTGRDYYFMAVPSSLSKKEET